MRSVRSATCTRAEPVSFSCTLYFSSVAVLSKAMSPEIRCRQGGGLSEGKLVEHGKLAGGRDGVKGRAGCRTRFAASPLRSSDPLWRLRRPACRTVLQGRLGCPWVLLRSALISE